MPSLIWLTTSELKLPRPSTPAGVVEVALPYRGLTPNRWTCRALSGCTLVESRRRPPLEGSPGAGGYEAVRLELDGPDSPAMVVFALVDITGHRLEERRLHIAPGDGAL